MSNLEKLLAAGASVIIRPTRWAGLRFLAHKYGVAVEFGDFRNGLLGDDLEEILGRGLEWVETVKFCSGEQWTPEQVAAGYRRIKPSDIQAAFAELRKPDGFIEIVLD